MLGPAGNMGSQGLIMSLVLPAPPRAVGAWICWSASGVWYYRSYLGLWELADARVKHMPGFMVAHPEPVIA